ncbi:hypothetical protein GR268_47490, partial [Rhizobium leguminosarum]|nr:hypothetical protein [Rhizobium leguminosarum]
MNYPTSNSIDNLQEYELPGELQELVNSGKAGNLCLVGKAFYTGDGVGQNHEIAYEWYKKAAIKGDVVAQLVIKGMLDSGQGPFKDVNAAFQLMLESSKQKDLFAFMILGWMYQYGKG